MREKQDPGHTIHLILKSQSALTQFQVSPPQSSSSLLDHVQFYVVCLLMWGSLIDLLILCNLSGYFEYCSIGRLWCKKLPWDSCLSRCWDCVIHRQRSHCSQSYHESRPSGFVEQSRDLLCYLHARITHCLEKCDFASGIPSKSGKRAH